MLSALYDTETNGLLRYVAGKTVATKMHCLAIFFSDGRMYSCSDQPNWAERGIANVTLPSGKVLKGVIHKSNAEGIRELEQADIRVAFNGQDFDERILHKLYPWYNPKGDLIDPLHWSRLLYPSISREGPNSHKVPGRLRMSHSVKAWGYRLGEMKDEFDAGDWQTWSEGMQLYMLQDVASMQVIYKWLAYQKPPPLASKIEHNFAAIIRRQEVWGFTVDYEKLLALNALLENWKAALEGKLIDTFGSWWRPLGETRPKTTRKVKMAEEYGEITYPRYGSTGKRLPKDYVGPPRVTYTQGVPYTEVEYIEFSPGSRDHVATMLSKKYGWKPKKFTDKGGIAIDDEVLQALDYPEAPLLAAYYSVLKLAGYVSSGKNAWIMLAMEEADGWRIHGDVITIGTYTFRCSHMRPNMGQIPTRHPFWGHKARELFISRQGFKLVGFDGSGMQLRLLAHYMSPWDGGKFAKIVDEEDPHAYMRGICQDALKAEGYALGVEDLDKQGRERGKTTNYALCFGGGTAKLGSIWRPYISLSKQQSLGKRIKELMSTRLVGLAELNEDLKEQILENRYLVGLDGRKARVGKPNAALATLLQMGEAVVMKLALCILDRRLQDAGLRPGVSSAGIAKPATTDYEFCANVHDEAQADVRPEHVELYTKFALECVRDAGRKLGVQCRLKSDVSVGLSWAETH